MILVSIGLTPVLWDQVLTLSEPSSDYSIQSTGPTLANLCKVKIKVHYVRPEVFTEEWHPTTKLHHNPEGLNLKVQEVLSLYEQYKT
jgi:hypothetical protein